MRVPYTYMYMLLCFMQPAGESGGITLLPALELPLLGPEAVSCAPVDLSYATPTPPPSPPSSPHGCDVVRVVSGHRSSYCVEDMTVSFEEEGGDDEVSERRKLEMVR